MYVGSVSSVTRVGFLRNEPDLSQWTGGQKQSAGPFEGSVAPYAGDPKAARRSVPPPQRILGDTGNDANSAAYQKEQGDLVALLIQQALRDGGVSTSALADARSTATGFERAIQLLLEPGRFRGRGGRKLPLFYPYSRRRLQLTVRMGLSKAIVDLLGYETDTEDHQLLRSRILHMGSVSVTYQRSGEVLFGKTVLGFGLSYPIITFHRLLLDVEHLRHGLPANLALWRDVLLLNNDLWARNYRDLQLARLSSPHGALGRFMSKHTTPSGPLHQVPFFAPPPR